MVEVEVTLRGRLNQQSNDVIDVAASVGLLGEALKRQGEGNFECAVQLGWCLCRILEQKFLEMANQLHDLAETQPAPQAPLYARGRSGQEDAAEEPIDLDKRDARGNSAHGAAPKV